MTQYRRVKDGRAFQLGSELGRGGEGAVFAVEGHHGLVAKLYKKPPDPKKVQKLKAMAECAGPDLLRIASWPVDLITDQSGAVHGFLMPRIATRRDIHELYSPKSRVEAFPEANFQFLVLVAANVARAFAVVHAHGHVIGDVNHGNVLVGPDATVMMIDCDSFQIRTSQGLYTCDVGVPLFIPPELHNRSFRGLVRSQNHDCFGLAVLLFHLLFMGRHPFAGRYLGPGEMPIEKAITEYRFAYHPARATYRMQQPPGTVALETMGADIARAFVRAFDKTGESGSRPDAVSWAHALTRLKDSLVACPTVGAHHYPRDLSSCPWCSVEGQVGIRLFGQRITPGPVGGAIDLSALWRAITNVQGPGSDPILPSHRVLQTPALPSATLGQRVAKAARISGSLALFLGGFVACNAIPEGGGLLAALVAYGIAYAMWPRISAEERMTAGRAYAAAEADWKTVLQRWQREASEAAFAGEMERLKKAYAELVDLPNERKRRIRALELRREHQQRLRYLDRFRIDRARIPGIGTGRTSMLGSFGIETAADIDPAKIMRIPGFGEALTSELVHWRAQHERNFRFNPHEPLDPRDVQAIDRELESRRQTLLAAMRRGPDVLRRLNQEIAAARTRLMPVLEAKWESVRVTRAQRDRLF